MRRRTAAIACFLAGAAVSAASELSFAEGMQTARLQDRIHETRRDALHLSRFLATVCEGMEELEQALAFAQRVLDLDDSNEADALRTTNLLGKLGRPEDAAALLVARAEGRRPSVRLCRAAAAFAREAGNDELAAQWERRATAPEYDSASEHLTAASWLYSAGYMTECEDEWRHVLELERTGHQAASVCRSLGRDAILAQQWEEAAAYYIQAAGMRTEARGGALDGTAQRDAVKGYAYRALGKALAGDDAGSRADADFAVQLASGDLWSTADLLRALDTAPPTPWFVTLFERVAGATGWAEISLYAEATRHSAERWLAYQRSLPVLIKTERELSEDALRGLVRRRAAVRWIEQDKHAPAQRWVGTERCFVMLDDSTQWVVQWWPNVLDEVGVPELDARCIAFGPDAVWVGTRLGLFAYDRQRRRWEQCLVGDDMVEVSVSGLTLQDGRLLTTIAAAGKESRWELDLASQEWAQR